MYIFHLDLSPKIHTYLPIFLLYLSTGMFNGHLEIHKDNAR